MGTYHNNNSTYCPPSNKCPVSNLLPPVESCFVNKHPPPLPHLEDAMPKSYLLQKKKVEDNEV